ncbi:STAS domain-containing protein [Acidiluteibacter ferrifornacis]|uniref:STAS domain-containing protein n=1 Tax=Acidiluteibacter ferrifornacis TaxID=2692424 RepID=A0A6N9NMF6_9FLAO|nr:STAS domain-containing protein [Acidiluteibacter ferrifornacis]NBG67039.1 STAS domain-containing protein [Acidiluteibacter ferrifornacis]
MEYEIIKEEKFAAFKFSTEKLTAIIAPSVKADIIVLNEEGYSNFILDLSNVQYCDSSGLSAILVANRVAKENRGILVVCSLQPSVDKLIKISQLDGILNIVPSYNEAMDYIFMEELEKGLDDIF